MEYFWLMQAPPVMGMTKRSPCEVGPTPKAPSILTWSSKANSRPGASAAVGNCGEFCA